MDHRRAQPQQEGAAPALRAQGSAGCLQLQWEQGEEAGKEGPLLPRQGVMRDVEGMAVPSLP